MLVLAVVAIALGTPSGEGTISGKKLATRGERATLVFEVGTRTREASEVLVPMQLAPGARLTGMTVTVGGATLVTRAVEPDRARTVYGQVHRVTLLEHVASGDVGDELRLRVSFVSRGERARIALTVALDAKPRDGDWMSADTVPRGYVAPTLSLVARPDLSAMPTVTISQPVSSCGVDIGLDGRAIRKFIRRQLPRLEACYERALRTERTLAGTAVMHFDIPPDGRVTAISVDGTLPSDDVRACIAADLAQWQLPEVRGSTTTVRINYPLTFRPST